MNTADISHLSDTYLAGSMQSRSQSAFTEVSGGAHCEFVATRQ